MNKPETITKEKIAEKLKERLGFSTTICEEITNTIFSEILRLTIRDKKTMMQNFGTWKINYKKSRPGFDIRLNKPVEIKSRTVLRFLPSKPLKDEVNK